MSRHPIRSDLLYGSRTPTDARSVLTMFAMLALVPLALWAAENLALAAAALAAVLALRLLVGRVARRRRGEETTLRVPGVDAQFQVRVQGRPNR
ncbi:hypothetical protein [Halomarina ordinaria]|uniref:DUF58 domain-containing protein n=1 Tax=Halomarina ordinaria TaxID=3033939 RepID=A0ABD5U3T2_9EURY|nr:hypothetical protein [Halomarina sp. PSRA2]